MFVSSREYEALMEQLKKSDQLMTRVVGVMEVMSQKIIALEGTALANYPKKQTTPLASRHKYNDSSVILFPVRE